MKRLIHTFHKSFLFFVSAGTDNVPADLISGANIRFYSWLTAATAAAAVSSRTGSRNRHYIVIIAGPEAISEASLITCIKAC